MLSVRAQTWELLYRVLYLRGTIELNLYNKSIEAGTASPILKMEKLRHMEIEDIGQGR